MNRSIFVPVASALVALFVVACDEPADQAGSRGYVVHNVVEARQIVSEVLRGDERVAEVVLADDHKHITLLADDLTVVSAPLDYDARAELDRYSAELADAVGVLEQARAQVVPRSDCGYAEYYDWGIESECIVSWCSGGCWAVDCIPVSDRPLPEYHYISPECGVN